AAGVRAGGARLPGPRPLRPPPRRHLVPPARLPRRRRRGAGRARLGPLRAARPFAAQRGGRAVRRRPARAGGAAGARAVGRPRGHALGGAVAALYAAALPEQAERLVLVESLGPLPFRGGTGAETLQAALAARRRAGAKAPRVYPDLAAAIAGRRAANGLSEAAARLLVERGVVSVAGGLTWR